MELQANRPRLDPWKGSRVANPGNYFQTHEQENHQEWPAWLDQVELIFDQLDKFLRCNFWPSR